MECIHCKGNGKCGAAPLILDRNGYRVSRDAIPAWVCSRCGEPLFESRKVDLIQNALGEFNRERAALNDDGQNAAKP